MSLNYYLVKGEVDYVKFCRGFNTGKKFCNECFYGGHETGLGHFEEKVEAYSPEGAIEKALTQIRKNHTPKGIAQKDVYWSEDGGEQEVEFLGKVADEIIMRRKGFKTLWDQVEGAA